MAIIDSFVCVGLGYVIFIQLFHVLSKQSHVNVLRITAVQYGRKLTSLSGLVHILLIQGCIITLIWIIFDPVAAQLAVVMYCLEWSKITTFIKHRRALLQQ